jgi:hypothetical protein
MKSWKKSVGYGFRVGKVRNAVCQELYPSINKFGKEKGFPAVFGGIEQGVG